MGISVLFIPFDAVIQHARRNAENGVDGTQVETARNSKKRKYAETISGLEPSGDLYALQSAKKKATASAMMRPLPSTLVNDIVTDDIRQIEFDRRMDTNHPYDGTDAVRTTKHLFNKMLKVKALRRAPDVLFLSERPSGLTFPDQSLVVSVPDAGDITYDFVGKAGERGAQEIWGYVKTGLGGTWTAKEKKKHFFPKSGNAVDEHVLVVIRELNGKRVSIAGVHLSSKNTSLSSLDDRENVIKTLKTFCTSQEPPISFAIGDFNIDVHTSVLDGHVGVVPRSMAYLAPDPQSVLHGESASMATRATERFSNSTNSAHYMGHVVVDP